jgi:hypothetical protein
MNRQEAATIIKAIGKHAIETHLTDPGDILDATVMAVQALVPKPDEVTGLVPCGCGGRAVLDGAYGDDEVESSYRTEIYCEQCLIRTPIYTEDEQVKAAWNRAMGYTPSGAIGPEPDGMAPIGDKGVEQ